ncbi:MAG: hypothetical protein KAS72_01905 [Phycisphaerales bacterium]|nr:hypothetical protein [Phycisphaerales bacterium]
MKSTEPPSRSNTAPRRSAEPGFPGLLALAWLVYLLAAAALTLLWRQPPHPDALFFGSAMRRMIVLMTVGLLILWPMIRLSQPPGRSTTGSLLIDIIIMFSMIQVVIWPMRFVTRWTSLQMGMVDVMIASWAVLISGIVAVGVAPASGRGRWRAMTACVLLIFAGPGLAAAVEGVGGMGGAGGAGGVLPHPISEWLTSASPLTMIFTATADNGHIALQTVLWTSGAAVAVGVVLHIIATARQRRQGDREVAGPVLDVDASGD